MNDRKIILDKFYNDNCDEETRLSKRHRQLEYLTTIKYIDKYLKKGDKILEVGAGTGAYSLYYASKGSYDNKQFDDNYKKTSEPKEIIRHSTLMN